MVNSVDGSKRFVQPIPADIFSTLFSNAYIFKK